MFFVCSLLQKPCGVCVLLHFSKWEVLSTSSHSFFQHSTVVVQFVTVQIRKNACLTKKKSLPSSKRNWAPTWTERGYYAIPSNNCRVATLHCRRMGKICASQPVGAHPPARKVKFQFRTFRFVITITFCCNHGMQQNSKTFVCFEIHCWEEE